MTAPFVAEIRIFGFNFAPTGWAQCNGQLMPISQNTALFSLLGTFYGGDGKSTFALPDLQGSVPVHQGQGQGLSQRFLGEQSGAEFVTLLQSEIPVHSHSFSQSVRPADNLDPTALALGTGNAIYAAPGAIQQAAPQALGIAGGSLPHNNMMPYLTLNICIALQGAFPARN
ncbi:MAG TPA: tail fiber protein [Croceibacterium sp.]|nr:tail fiber protein [Croceibacterium sp.]